MILVHLGESSISLDPKNVEIYTASGSFYLWDTKNIILSKIIINGFRGKTVSRKGWIHVLESFVNL